MIEIKVPATSANLGPGFDCLGIALNLYNTFTVEETSEGLLILGADDKYANENNLVFTSMKKTFEKIGYDYKGIKITIDSNIPISRGLGSSASCIIGGILAANTIGGNVLSNDEILKLATEIEGHPDNVAPALLGGMTVSILEEDKVYYSKINVQNQISFYALIPEFELSTEDARAVLPKKVSFKDAVYNISRVSLMLTALINEEYDLLRIACKDKLHQPYRGKLIEDYDTLISKIEELDSNGVFLSGAGPTIITMVKEENNIFLNQIEQFVKTLKSKWKIKKLNIDYQGALVKQL